MPLQEEGYDAAQANAAWRAGFGQNLSGADKQALAQELGVTVRTVQRWTTTAGEQRNPIPARLADVPEDEWPATYRTRSEMARRLTDGGANEETETALAREFGKTFGSVAEAQRWAEALEREELDPWLTAAWRRYRVTKTADGWRVTVAYDALVSPAAAA